MLDIYNTTMVILKCEAEGNPLSEISWLRNDHFISNENDIQIFILKSVEDIYKCIAKNNLNEMVVEIKLNFILKPTLTSKYQKYHKLREMEDFLLECPIESKIDRCDWLEVNRIN